MRLTIQVKITCIILAVVAVVLTYVNVRLKDELRAHLNIWTETYFRSQASLVENILIRYDIKSEKGLIKEALQNWSDDIHFTVVRTDGHILFESQQGFFDSLSQFRPMNLPEIRSALSTGEGLSRRQGSQGVVSTVYYALSFVLDGERLLIHIVSPQTHFPQIELELNQALLMALFGGAILSIIMGFGASLFVSRPIRQMAEVSKTVASGNLSRKLQATTNDEIKDLTVAFNEMIDQMKFRIDEVIENKSRLEAILLSMFGGLMVVDNDGIIIFINQNLKDMLRIDRDVEGRRPLQVVRNVEIQEVIDSILFKSSGVVNRELSIIFPQERVLNIHATPVIRDGGVAGAVLVFHDISDLRRLEMIRQDFVANVSHELRTPIATIKGYTETLIDGALDDKKHAQEFLEIIYKDADRLAKLVEDLLELAKLESGKLRIERKPCDLKAIIDRVVLVLAPAAAKKDVVVNNEIIDKLRPVALDEEKIIQVFLNLIENAIKYNKKGGFVRIQAEMSADEVAISVEDSGLGISERDMPRLFERFYRADKAHSRDLGGTGLGLAIVKHIVQAHQGDVHVKSYLDQGAIFTVHLPQI